MEQTKSAISLLSNNFQLIDEEDHGCFQEWEATSPLTIFGMECKIAIKQDGVYKFYNKLDPIITVPVSVSNRALLLVEVK